MNRSVLFALFTVLFCGLQTSAQPIPIVVSVDAGIQSSGVKGITVFDSNPAVLTARSGGSNIRHGAFVFDLSSVPDSTSVTSAALRVVTTNLISNTQATATISYHGYASDGTIDETDFGTPASQSSTLLAEPTYPTAAAGPDAGTPLTITLDNLTPLQQAITNGSDFFTVRSETVNFVTFSVASLENTDDRAAVELIVNYDLPCDFDADDACTIDDIDMLVGALAASSTDLQFDVDESGTVDSADLDEWLSFAGQENLPVRRPYLYGDADLNGTVDGTDFLAWNANKFENVATWSGGDFTADGVVDGADFLRWNANKFQSSDVTSVPEPIGVSSVLIGLLGLTVRLRRE